jgi:ElaB/YqjD/DUF883 family membrane-anchored ribosome-binding protein
MRQRDARRISMARRTTPRLTRSESLEDGAETIEEAVRDFVESRPYTTPAIALGIGWLIGTMVEVAPLV